MITSTKLFVLLSGSAGAAVVGAAPTFQSDVTLTALFAAGAVTVTSGIVQLVRSSHAEA